jgi:hypothetical protein
VLWVRLLELAVGLVLAMAAVSKLARLDAFAAALRTYRMTPEGHARSLALAAVAAEGVVGVALLSQRLPVLALAAAACLFAWFAVVGWVESRAPERGSRADCGCLGGVVRLRVGRVTIAVNAGIAVASAGAAVVAATAGTATATGTEVAVLWAAGLLFAALYWTASYAMTVVATMEEAV